MAKAQSDQPSRKNKTLKGYVLLKPTLTLKRIMKNVIRILFLICFIGIQTITYAQLNTKRIETKQFHKKTDPVHYKYVDMDFNSSAIQNKLSRINAEEVQSITLVYTQFKLVERFDQLALNTKRIDLLLKNSQNLNTQISNGIGLHKLDAVTQKPVANIFMVSKFEQKLKLK